MGQRLQPLVSLVQGHATFMAGQPTPRRATYPPQKYGLIKGLLTIGFPQYGLIKPLFLGGVR